MVKQDERSKNTETDSAFLLKVVIYVILASIWFRLANPIEWGVVSINGIPVGLLVGLLVARHDKFQIDRKIEYVILIVVAIFTCFLPIGIII